MCSIVGCEEVGNHGFNLCAKHYGRHYRARHPERREANNRRYLASLRLRKYGLSQEQFDILLTKQNNRCAICKTDKPNGRGKTWHVDHNHGTNVVRGILCSSCNTGLGMFADSVKTLRRAVQYLIRSSV